MKKFFLLFAILVSLIGFSQNCKFKINKIDDFTKSRIIKTQPRVIASELGGHNVIIGFVYDAQMKINIELSMSQHWDIITDENSFFQFLMKDGKVLTFNIEKIIAAKIKGSGLMASTELDYNFDVSQEDLQYIKSIGIDKIRFQGNNFQKDFVVKNKSDIEKMNFNIECFIKEVAKI